MRTTVVLKFVVAFVYLLSVERVDAQEVQLTLNVTSWSLASKLGSQKDVVTNLTLIGEINAFDISTLRSMAKLTKLNLADVKLVAGGNFYVNKDIVVENDKIPEYMFFNLSNLTSVNLPKSATFIGDYAFKDCTRLTLVTLGDKVDSIGSFAFGNCSGLSSITLPEGLKVIGNQAFWSCTWIEVFTIPASVTYIGSGAFSICSALKNFIVSENNLFFSSLEGVLFNKNQTELIAYPNSKSAVYTVPQTVKTIGDYAFGSSPGINSVYIGNNVTSIGEGAFYNCLGLASVSLGNNVTSIGNSVFYNCVSLTSIKIPDSVLSIGRNAFGNCNVMTILNLGNKLSIIDVYAFTNCTGLTDVTLPGSVTSVGDWAFSYCTGLTGIYCKSQYPPVVNVNTFYGVDKTSCILYVPKESVSTYKVATFWESFVNINVDPTSISEQFDTDSIKVYAESGVIVVKGADSKSIILVYNESGYLVRMLTGAGGLTRISLPGNGVYLVNVNKKVYKVLL